MGNVISREVYEERITMHRKMREYIAEIVRKPEYAKEAVYVLKGIAARDIFDEKFKRQSCALCEITRLQEWEKHRTYVTTCANCPINFSEYLPKGVKKDIVAPCASKGTDYYSFGTYWEGSKNRAMLALKVASIPLMSYEEYKEFIEGGK